MKIDQLYSNFGIGFSEAIRKKYGFQDFTDSSKPLFIFGCYGERQIHFALSAAKYSPMVVICWGGSDAKILKELELSGLVGRNFWGDALRKTPNIKHIAISHWIEEDLQILRLPYFRVPITPHDSSGLEPCIRGNSIYMYRPDVDTYNGGIYNEIKSKLNFPFIETNSKTYKRDELIEIYKSCFIGLRFTEHDGLSNTVCELGMMGRRVVHNGDTPNCIYYNKDCVESIIDSINYEYHRKDDTNEISEKMREFLNIGEDFLQTDYYVNSSVTSME